jgi:hypothetical protein
MSPYKVGEEREHLALYLASSSPKIGLELRISLREIYQNRNGFPGTRTKPKSEPYPAVTAATAGKEGMQNHRFLQAHAKTDFMEFTFWLAYISGKSQILHYSLCSQYRQRL